jgi:acyl-ACP thioesterase
MEMIAVPNVGRVFSAERRVRLGDITTTGRLRLDALARYLQDVSNDDTRASGLTDPWDWLVRRTELVVHAWPQLDDLVTLQTFCGGIGPRWAERRVRVAAESGAVIDAATIWVSMDRKTGRPRPLSDSFHEIFAATASGRRVSARLDTPEVPDDPQRLAWSVRASDLDVLGHVNNTNYWAGVEEVLYRSPTPDAPLSARLGFVTPIEAQHRIEVLHDDADQIWFRNLDDATVHAAGVLHR